MPVERAYAHPEVRADVGRVCLKRGPLAYCLEQVDNPDAAVNRLRVPRAAALGAVQRPDLFGGIITLEGEVELVSDEGWEGQLYRPQPPAMRRATFTAVPYYIWNNRDPNRMLVWLPQA